MTAIGIKCPNCDREIFRLSNMLNPKCQVCEKIIIGTKEIFIKYMEMSIIDERIQSNDAYEHRETEKTRTRN